MHDSYLVIHFSPRVVLPDMSNSPENKKLKQIIMLVESAFLRHVVRREV